jgi:capsular exopolysaccharide synthesis family protein
MNAQHTPDTTMSPVSDNNSARLSANHLNSIYPEELLEPNRGLNIREFWRVLMRRKKLLGLFIAASFLLTLLITLLMKPVYRATTTVQIEREPTKIADIVLEPSARRNERDFWQTQFELIKSNSLARTVIDKLQLEDSLTSGGGLFSFLKSANTPAETIFLKGLSVEPVNNSQLVMIHYESGDPEMATKIVNTIADSFISMNLERRYKSADSAKTFLQKQITEAKDNLETSEQKLSAFAQKNQIIELDNNQTTKTHVLKKLAEELVTAEKNRIELSSQFQQLELAAKSRDPSMILNNPYIQNLKKTLVKLETEYRKKVRKLGNRNASMRKLQKEIERTRGQIRTEANMLKEAVSSQYESAKQSEKSLQERLTQLQTETLDVQGKIHNYNNLKQEVSSNRNLYQNLLERLKEVGVAGGVDNNNISIIDPAKVPYKKYKPKIKMNLLFGLLMGLLLGIAAIFLREFMDDSIKDTDELERMSDLPMLGAIPNLSSRSKDDIAQQLIKEPKSKIAEAIRSLRTTLSFSTQDGAPKTLFFTSSEPGEGKTSTALNLATAYALAGNSVLIIDADLRSPSIHKILKQDNRMGLTNFLVGDADLGNVAQSTSITGLTSITAGPLPPDPVELLSGSRIKELLQTVATQYDHVIIDGPPVLGLADALILSNLAEATILTVHAGKTRKGPVTTSLKRLRQAKAHIIGTVMNQASHLGSGYGYDYLHYNYGNQKAT